MSKTAEWIAPRTALTPCILDDDPGQLEMLTSPVASMGYEAVPTADPEEALKLIERGRCRLALVDVHMPGMDGYEFLSQALQSDLGANILWMTGDYTLDSALEAIRRGASDFLPKPIDRARLKQTLDDAAKLHDQRRRVRVLEEQLLKDLEFHGIVGKSPAMLKFLILRARWRGITRMYCWRGDGFGQGAGGAGDSSIEPGEPAKTGGVQLFGAGGHAGEPAFRTYARSVYRSDGHAAGAV